MAKKIKKTDDKKVKKEKEDKKKSKKQTKNKTKKTDEKEVKKKNKATNKKESSKKTKKSKKTTTKKQSKKAKSKSKKGKKRVKDPQELYTPPKEVKEPKEIRELRAKIKKILNERVLPKKIVNEIIDFVLKDKDLEEKKNLEKIVETAFKHYDQNIIDPSEACGIVGAQSIGEPGTQMSIPYNEKILVKQNQKIKVCEIGKFVDDVMNVYGHGHIKESEVCDLPPEKEIFVPSLNKNEKIEWKKILACSRHKSPKKLLQINTRSGRKIQATDAHSFVIRNNNKIVPIAGKNLQPGDRIPVVKKLEENCISSLDLGNYLDIDNMDYAFQQNDLIYPYPSKKPLPKDIKLDSFLGWFVGAYLAEGNSTKYYTSISNTDKLFQSKIREFAKKHGFTFNEYDNERGFSLGHDIRINSSLLSCFMKRSCGTGAANKKVPDFSYSAEIDFVCALLRGYFDGDGNISLDRKSIRASSSSKELIDGIALLLNRLGIFSSKCKNKKGYSLQISYRYAPLFLQKIGLDNKSKKEKLEKLSKFVSLKNKSYDITDMIPGFGKIFYEIADKLGFPKRLVNNFTKRQRIGRTTLSRYIEKFEKLSAEKNIDIDKEIKTLKKMLNADVVWDEIKDISYVDINDEYVYDLSVDGLETFTTFDGVITHNTMRTFHYAGVAEINVTLGLPRLIEIVDARSAPSTPMMNIYLKDEYKLKSDLAKKVANQIEISRLNSIADIETDLTNLVITIKPDKQTIKSKDITKEDILEKVSKIRKIEAKQEKDKIKVTLDDPSYKKLLGINETLKDLKVKGIDGIKRIIIRKEPNEGYVIYSEGSNLEKVLEIEGVDPFRTNTNDIQAVGRVLGIEAARNMIIQEAHNTLSEQGLNVDLRHIMLVSDVMTSDGTIRAIGRHGVSKEKESVLSRAAFEITVSHLLKAARKGETDELGGVAENIIVGQPVNLGTGAVELVMQTSKKKKKKGK